MSEVNTPFDHNSLDDTSKGESKTERARDHVRKFMTTSALYRRPHMDLAVWSRELYECWKVESKSLIQRANIKLPYGYTIIEQQIPQIIEGLLHERPLIDLQGEQPGDVAWEDEITDFMDCQLEDMKPTMKLASYVKSMKLDGTAFAKVPYKYKEQVVKKRKQVQDPLTGLSYIDKSPGIEVLADGPDFEPIPFIDAYPDWRVKVPGDIDSMRGFVHRTWRTLAELKSNKKRKAKDGTSRGIYDNFDELERSVRIKGAGDGAAWRDPYYSDDQRARLDRLNDNKLGIKEADQIEVWEYWGQFDVSGEGDFQEYIITIANGDVVIRCDDNFYDYKIKPFVATPNVIRDNEFYGIPELLAVKGLIKESNTIRNSILDQVNIGINQMFLVDRNAGINGKSLFSRPGGIVWANDISGMREIKQPEIPATALRTSQDIQGDIQQAVGQGNGPGNPSTFNTALARSATGAQYLQSFSASRAGLSLRILGETLVKPMYKIMFFTNRQFVTDDQYLRISDPNKQTPGNPFTLLPIDAFTFNYQFKLSTKLESGGAEGDLQKIQQLMQMLQVAEGTQPGITNWAHVFDAVGRDLVGFRYKKFIRTDQERLQLQQQQLMQQAQAQGVAGALKQSSQPGNAAVGAASPQSMGPMGTGGGGVR